MKKKCIATTALACILAAGTVSAQTGRMMQAAPPGQQQDSAQSQTSPPMGPGMMGGGMGMGPGMMGGGQGGMGLGQGMMGGGMGHGMMGNLMGCLDPEDQQRYLDATKDLRKKLNDKQFDYLEMARNPKTPKSDLLKKRKELWDIQQKIHEKAWDFMKE